MRSEFEPQETKDKVVLRILIVWCPFVKEWYQSQGLPRVKNLSNHFTNALKYDIIFSVESRWIHDKDRKTN